MSTSAIGKPRPLRVLQITSAAVGGNWFHDQVRGLAELGNEVCAVLPREGPLADRLREVRGVRVEIIPFGVPHRIGQLPVLMAGHWRLMRFVRAYRPDVIHSHLIIAKLVARVVSAACPSALVVSQVPGLVHLRIAPFRILERLSLRRDDLVLGSCRAIARRYQAMGARSVAVSYYGCDVHRFDPATSPDAFRREFGLTDDTPAVGMVAYMYASKLREFRQVGVKGHEVFLDAIPLILRQNPEARFFVVGDELVGDGKYRRELERRAARLGIADRIRFTGFRSDISSVMAGLDILVNPSMDESACYTVVEALLMRKGVVATDVGGLPDTVQHGRTGLLIPPADPPALAQAVNALLADPAARLRMADRGRELALRQFDIAGTVGQVNELYHQALAARERRRLLRRESPA
ncbi:glycosyltransferase family 4 protein [Streptomyces sp. ALI-76-A]|jgi:glycosyltransferase involved in cell wall biosynthesis|uniref:glycosyltransferase family 4 protein n=1 Tax=Streptomyces sp. ALI-76-A TaxID=3025736 RepID=UPI00256F12EC|nr:glycosyltransferase family 4 protein [Streptomyces sp. ALI-76-A]MDL5206288.1 glycosyltransferase family 4 protein [Streptomyces sp. ALI-76-A]